MIELNFKTTVFKIRIYNLNFNKYIDILFDFKYSCIINKNIKGVIMITGIESETLNKASLVSLLEGELVQVNVIKVEVPKTPMMWSMQTFVEQAGFSKNIIMQDIRSGVLQRDKHYVMKGAHYLFIRDEVVPYILNKFKLKRA